MYLKEIYVTVVTDTTPLYYQYRFHLFGLTVEMLSLLFLLLSFSYSQWFLWVWFPFWMNSFLVLMLLFTGELIFLCILTVLGFNHAVKFSLLPVAKDINILTFWFLSIDTSVPVAAKISCVQLIPFAKRLNGMQFLCSC